MSNSAARIRDNGGIDYIKQCKLEGKTQRETAKELGYSNPKVIYNYLKKEHNTSWADLPESEDHKNINLVIAEKGGLSYIIQLKNQGYTLQEIGEELGYKSSVPLRQYLRRNNIIWKNIGFNKTSSHNRVVDNDEKIIEEVRRLVNKGYSLGEIQESIGLSNPYLNQVFRRNNLSLKKFTYQKHETPIERIINENGGINYLLDKDVKDLSVEWDYSYNYTKTEIREYLKGSDYKLSEDRIVKKIE